MGRYLTPSGAAAGGGSSSMRSQRHVLTASNPALPVPAWAKAARVSGCAAGGGGAVLFGSVGGVLPGGCGGIAHDALVPLLGVATLAIVIGAGGIGKAAGSSGQGGAGGNTTLTAGPYILTLEGANGTVRGRAFIGTVPPIAGYSADSPAAGLMPGYIAVEGNGAPSPWGAGGAYEPSEVGDGGNATGYGAGGGGSHGGKGGNGAPGLLIIEFLEAA